MKTHLLLGLGFLALALLSCGPTPKPAPAVVASSKIDRHPAPAVWSRNTLTVLPAYNATSNDPYQLDLRAVDLSRLDLRESASDLMYSDFDSRTRWPAEGMMPAGFDWKQVMDLGTNPGVRNSHCACTRYHRARREHRDHRPTVAGRTSGIREPAAAV